MKRKLSALGKRLLSFLLVLSLVCSMGIPVSAAGHREDTVSLPVGESIRLNASGWNTKWSSSDEAVATVSRNGTVTGVSVGTATITATTRGFRHGSGTVRYTVVVTAPEEVTITRGETLRLSVDGKGKATWTSSDPDIAAVDRKGNVTGVSAGTVTITARIRNHGGFWNHGKNSTKTVTFLVTVVPVSYTVTFETNGGSAVDAQTVEENNAAAEPEVPTLEGYNFTGWYSDAELTTAYDFSAPVTADLTLYAGWEKASDLSLEGYTLRWQDEFEGERLNREDWNVELHDPGWVNAEWQAYVDSEENIYIQDGSLILKPVKTVDEAGNATYTSGRVNTQGKHDFTYGIFEARVKVPTGMGYLPAFWLMASDENLYGQWPRCGEIDIMEVMGQDTTTSHGTIHYGNPHAQSQGTYVLEEGNFSDEYHTFAVEWEPGRIRWYVDGNLFHEESDWYSTTEGQGTITYPAPFDQPFYVILNLAIGGSWVGYPDETTTFEDQEYAIDYVRVYQKDSYDENVERPVEEIVIREPDETGNYVINGDFSVAEALDDDSDWIFMTAQGGVGSAEIADGQLHITTENAGTVDYSVQLVQPNLPMERGGTYKLTFDAYADETRTVIVDVSAPQRSWIRYLADTRIEVGPETQSYAFEFTMTESDDPYGRLEFNLGNQCSTAGFHLSNVRLEKISQVEIVDEKGILADGNHVYNGSFQEGDGRLGYWTVEAGADSQVSVTNENNIRRLMIVAGEGVSAENPVVVYQADLALAANSNYAVSYTAEGPAGNTLLMQVAGVSFDAALDGTVQSVSGTFTTGDEFGKTIAFTVTQPGTYYIDDVRVVEDSLIKNGSFDAGLAGYEPYVDSSASASYVVDSMNEDNAFDITINNTGDQDWKIQLKQTAVNLVQGQWYRLTLDMKSSMDRQVMVALQRDGSIHGDDWTPYCQETVEVTGAYTTYTFEFQMNPGTAPYSDPDTVLSISMGAVGGTQITEQHRVCIDNISLEKIDAPADPIEPKPAGEELIANGDFSDGANHWDTMAVTAPATGSINVVDGKAVAEITNAGDADWNVQMIHYGIQLDQGATYELTFTGSSTADREIAVNLMSNTYAWYGGTGAALTAEEQTFTLTFTMGAETNVDAGLFISMGKTGDSTPASTITLDNFSLKKVGAEEPEVEAKPVGEELVVNGDFSSGSENWATFGVTSPAEGTLTVEDGKAVAAIVNPGDADWNVQMIQYGIQLEQGCTYELTFRASSTADRGILVNLMSSSYVWYGGFTANLTAEEQTFTLTFTMEAETNNDAGLFISMGRMAEGDTPASTITLDNISLKKVG